jgi:hypothetical protein
MRSSQPAKSPSLRRRRALRGGTPDNALHRMRLWGDSHNRKSINGLAALVEQSMPLRIHLHFTSAHATDVANSSRSRRASFVATLEMF